MFGDKVIIALSTIFYDIAVCISFNDDPIIPFWQVRKRYILGSRITFARVQAVGNDKLGKQAVKSNDIVVREVNPINPATWGGTISIIGNCIADFDRDSGVRRVGDDQQCWLQIAATFAGGSGKLANRITLRANRCCIENDYLHRENENQETANDDFLIYDSSLA